MKQSTPAIQEISSRPLKSVSDTSRDNVAAGSAPSTTSKARDPWVVREINGHRVGGGLIRQPAKQKLAIAAESPTKSTAPEASKDANTSDPTPFDIMTVSSSKPPVSLFEFTRAWNAKSSARDQWALLQVGAIVQGSYDDADIIRRTFLPHHLIPYFSHSWSRRCLCPSFRCSSLCSATPLLLRRRWSGSTCYNCPKYLGSSLST